MAEETVACIFRVHVKTAGFFERLVALCKTPSHQNPNDSNLQALEY